VKQNKLDAAGINVDDLQYDLEQAHDDIKELEAKLELRNNRIKELESSIPLKGPKSAGSAVNAVRSKRTPRRSATERYDEDFDDD